MWLVAAVHWAVGANISIITESSLGWLRFEVPTRAQGRKVEHQRGRGVLVLLHVEEPRPRHKGFPSFPSSVWMLG